MGSFYYQKHLISFHSERLTKELIKMLETAIFSSDFALNHRFLYLADQKERFSTNLHRRTFVLQFPL